MIDRWLERIRNAHAVLIDSGCEDIPIRLNSRDLIELEMVFSELKDGEDDLR